MLNDWVVWRNFMTPTPETRYKFFTSTAAEDHIYSSTVSQTGRADTRLPSFSAYLGLFVCLLLFLLALIIVMLYRMKHTVAPLRTDVETAGQTEMFPEVELGTLEF